MKKISLFLFILFTYFEGFAQELNCNVIINDKQLKTTQATERQIFTDMQKTISNFMNNRKWSNDVFEPVEKIKCNLVITLLSMPTQGSFLATAQIQVTRPVYGTNYETLLLNFVDRNFDFQYIQSQPLDYNDNFFSNNLTSLLGFYAYVILALDYDSFSKTSGTPFVEKAFNVVNVAQNSPEKGWQRGQDTRNRYWLSENLQSSQLLPLREGSYTYHRLAIDKFLENPDAARTKILEVLAQIEKVNMIKPAAILTNSFFDAKIDELINIFKEATPEEKQKAYTLLTKMDPNKTQRYTQILQQQ